MGIRRIMHLPGQIAIEVGCRENASYGFRILRAVIAKVLAGSTAIAADVNCTSMARLKVWIALRPATDQEHGALMVL